MAKKDLVRVCIDRGGTFTDCIAFIPTHMPGGHPTSTAEAQSGFKQVVVKLLSVDPTNYGDAPTEGIRRILEIATGKPHPRGHKLDTSNIELIRMGTTVATNALLERKGDRVALLITKGFKDLLHIGNQARPNIFDLSIASLDVLYDLVVEIDERVTPVGFSAVPSSTVDVPVDDPQFQQGVTGEWVRVIKQPEELQVKQQLNKIAQQGIKSVAICLMHAFTYPQHEQLLQKQCEAFGFDNITVSSSIMPMVKIVSRGTSATADAYLTPCINRYLQGFFSGFDNGIHKLPVEFMQSDGGLVRVNEFNGFKAILSGPAGGVVGYAMTSWQEGRAVIGFDMGGTSTDVSRFSGRYEHVFETTTAGVTIQAPQLDINTVAAGGGSQLFFRNGMFVVGPESAGADPGPACYRKGGPLAVTDANLLLGRLIPDYFPKIFGKSEKEALDIAATRKSFQQLAKEVNQFMHAKSESGEQFKPMSLDEIAIGFIKVANESMCRPIRALTEGKGYNAADHILASFGGAGGQHAFAIARSLGIKQVLIHRHSSILSAYGIALADVVKEVQEPSACEYCDANLPNIKKRISELNAKCAKALSDQGFAHDDIETEVFLNLRYQGTDNAIMTPKPKTTNDWNVAAVFIAQYEHEFGFTLPDRSIELDDIRVRGTGKSAASGQATSYTRVYEELKSIHKVPVDKNQLAQTASCYWEGSGRVDTPIYELNSLKVGNEVLGPALIIDATATIVIEPNCSAVVTSEHIVGFVGAQKHSKPTSTEMDPILLSVFGHRFMSIAEQMGRTLQKTSISTNIKERLDFSCALFGPDAGLVANAPHIPVHLGSMQEAVRWQLNHLRAEIRDGDVIVTNHPASGGSHLPDITVITPVFEEGKIVFFVASRGHHADIGGIQPGSMPPNSRELFQEGAAIKSFKLVQGGKFDEAGITRLLKDEPAKYEGCSGTRCLRDNISDLKAQVAANHKGITLVKSLIKEYGLGVVKAYMGYIRENAELAVRQLLKSVAEQHGTILEATDYMDDGTPIKLRVEIDARKGAAVMDFEGTGLEVYANTNAPRSVTYSAIIYCLRCLINIDIPLNQGALVPIDIKIPQGCFLNPSENAAVVGGNVLTSQRLCDVILKAFKACAASQGCCNNLTFGMGGKGDDGQDREGFGYYETIAGGSGAGPSWTGRSGVHTHMTNTRITDPEILERRYPVILRQFGLREGSGGDGLFRGGDGVIRELEFLETLHVSILSERRVFEPYGLNGGFSGKRGQNTLIRKLDDGSKYLELNFGGKNATIVKPGDRIRIETPGGGGYGSPTGIETEKTSALKRKRKAGNASVEPRRNVPRRTGGGSLQAYTDMQYSA